MNYNKIDERNNKSLNEAIQEYRENRECLLKIQESTTEAFSQITAILKPTTAELLNCVNVDNIAQVTVDLGAMLPKSIDTEIDSNEEYLYKTVFEKQSDPISTKIGNPAIAIVGQVKAGKSTFINVLLKKNVVCQAYERCTARITRLTYSNKNYIEILNEKGEIVEKKNLKASSIPKKYLQLKEEDRNDPKETNKQIKAGIKSQFLENGIDIIDTPGLSENSTLNNLSKNMIKSILPVMIYIIDGRTSVKQTDISDLLELKMSVPNLQIIYFITKLDVDDRMDSKDTNPIQLAEFKLEMAFQKLQYNNFIPLTFKHWSECPYFHGASLYEYMDYYKSKRTLESLYHFQQFGRFENALNHYLLFNFENKINEASNVMINFQMDVLTKIINRAQALVDFTKENLNQIAEMRKIEEGLFEKMRSVISLTKKDLVNRLIKRLDDETDSIIDPIGEIQYPAGLNIPENGMVMDKVLIQYCQNTIMNMLCQGLENIIRQFVEEELIQKYRDAIENQMTTRMKSEMENLQAKSTGKSSYRLSLERLLFKHYKIHSIGSLSKSDGNNAILRFMGAILVSMINFFMELFGSNTIKECVDVRSPQWKIQQARECLNKCDHVLLAEDVCKNLIHDFEEKHNSFLMALEMESKFVQQKISISEDIRTKMTERAPDFAGLLMLTLDVKSRYMLQNIVQKEKIGQGAQGEVYHCVCNGRDLAKKTVNLPINQLNEIAEEVYYSYLFEHPRLLPMVAVSITELLDAESKQISVYAPLLKSDVSKYLKKNTVSFQERMKIGLQVAEALEYLHSQQIMHRDLKLANILLDENNDVFLADYGFCKSMALSNHSFVGTPVHIAPEIVRKNMYDYKVDIYSFGMLLWYLAEGTGKHPRFARVQSNVAQVLWAATEHNMRPEKLDNIPEDLWNLMEICWDNEPSVRPDIDYVIAEIHKIMSKYSNQNH